MRSTPVKRRLLGVGVGAALAAFFGYVLDCGLLSLVAFGGRSVMYPLRGLCAGGPALGTALFLVYAFTRSHRRGPLRPRRRQLAIFLPALTCGLAGGALGCLVDYLRIVSAEAR